MFRTLMIGAAAAAGVLAWGEPVQAQYYYPGPQRGYYVQQPTYVPPRIARKQAQQRRRFVENFGYGGPPPRYGYGYGVPAQRYGVPAQRYDNGYRAQQYGYPTARPRGYQAEPRYAYPQGYGRGYQPNYGGGSPGGSPIRDP